MNTNVIMIIMLLLSLSLFSACEKSDSSGISIGNGSFQIVFTDDGRDELHNIRARSNVQRGVIEEDRYCGSNEGDYYYALGSKGFTFINLKTEIVIQTQYINEFEIEQQEALMRLINACNINKEKGNGRYLTINPHTYKLERE